MSEYSTPSFRQNKNMETLPKTCGPNPWDLFTVWFPVIQSTETLRYGYTITAKVAWMKLTCQKNVALNFTMKHSWVAQLNCKKTGNESTNILIISPLYPHYIPTKPRPFFGSKPHHFSQVTAQSGAVWHLAPQPFRNVPRKDSHGLMPIVPLRGKHV